MGRMGTSALRNIRALVARDLLDAVRNPTTLMSCAAGALVAAFFGRVVAGAPRLSAAEGDAFALVAALCIAPAFAGCVVELYVMAEERERGAHVTLAEAGVAPGEIAISKWASGTIAAGAQPLLLAGLASGLYAREQMASSLLAVPLTVVAVAPVLSFVSGTVRSFTWFWTLGPAAEAVRAACGASAAAPAPVLAALAVAWTAAAAALAVRGCRRFARELAAERDRLA